jgi:hypothetical protein
MTLSISRIYAVDGVETCILAEGEGAQALLRQVEAAAEQIGAAPNPLPFTGAAAGKKPAARAKKTDDAVTAKVAEGAPALPPGVATAFPSPPAEPTLPFGAPTFAPPQNYAPSPAPPADATFAPPQDVTWGPEAPQQFGSSVGLAPPPGPPSFAPPTAPAAVAPPLADPREPLRRRCVEAQSAIYAMVSARQPAWIDNVSATMNGILAALGGDLRAMSEEQLTAAIGQYRQYEDVLKKHLGLV